MKVEKEEDEEEINIAGDDGIYTLYSRTCTDGS
jgi:hypothetical protein